MHLQYFVQYFPPEQASGLSVITEMLEGFAKHGWEIDVYVPTPTRGVTDEERKAYEKRRKEVLYGGKLTIHRMHLYREKTGMAQRTIRYSLFSLQCLIRGLALKADAVFTGGGPPTQGIIGGLIHKWSRKKFIFNPQDLFPDSLIVAGKATEESRSVKIGRKIERFAYRNADVIITITEDMAESIRSRTADKEKVHVVRNWIDPKKTVPIRRAENRLFDEFRLPRDRFYVTYAGNIGVIQGVEIIVEAAERLQSEEEIQFVIFGNGSEEQKIRQMIVEKGLKNIRMFPLQPPERVSEVYSLGDLSVIPGRPGTGSIAMPSKTWTIMAAGTAVIATCEDGRELGQTINDAGCGCCTEPGNVEALAEAILALHADRRQVTKMSENARKYAEEQISKEKAIGQYIEIIEDIMKA